MGLSRVVAAPAQLIVTPSDTRAPPLGARKLDDHLLAPTALHHAGQPVAAHLDPDGSAFGRGPPCELKAIGCGRSQARQHSLAQVFSAELVAWQFRPPLFV